MMEKRQNCGKCHRERHRIGGGGRHPIAPPKQPESVKVGLGPSTVQMPLPMDPAERKKKKEEIEGFLLQNWDIPSTAKLAKSDMPTVRAIWGTLKEQERVPRDAAVGFLAGMEPKRLAAEPKTSPQPSLPQQAATPVQYALQQDTQSQPGPTSPSASAIHSQPVVPQGYVLVRQPPPQPQLQNPQENPQGLQVVPYNPATTSDGGGIPPRYPINTFDVEASGMVAKVFNSPKNLMWYDWFKRKSKFEGDYADFIADCIEDFFKSRGWQIVFTKQEKVS